MSRSCQGGRPWPPRALLTFEAALFEKEDFRWTKKHWE
jgi:hypothetical protein